MKIDAIYADIVKQLSKGVWREGEQLPTERTLAEQYGVSRPTIGRVLNKLRDEGKLRRVVGSGSYLMKPEQPAKTLHKKLGLFVPGLGKGEIFEPICARIAELSHEYNFSLIWGSAPAERPDALPDKLLQTARRFVELDLDGVFFQPIEREAEAENKNVQIVSLLDRASIPIVLLDGDYLTFPERSGHDIVGIDNTAAAYRLCQHFLKQGASRVDFLWQSNTAGTYLLRQMGYHEALHKAGIKPDQACEHEGTPSDIDFVRDMVNKGARNIICANDETAALLMRSLEVLDLKVPEDIRIAGFDDVKYAHLVRVPLTTMRQPCRELGELALNTLIERIETPSLPAHSILIEAQLCERESSRVPNKEPGTPCR
ncbi:MAG: LacI family DNA-binding transcriptional regulator [Rectinemataceae bacterium]